MNNEIFAKRLKVMRVQRGLSKSALAKAIGVTTTCVWNWEEGNTHPRPDTLTRAATALSTTQEFLERGVGPERHDTGPSPAAVTQTSEPVGDVIRRAREQIAAAAGLTFEQVKVVLEFGA